MNTPRLIETKLDSLLLANHHYLGHRNTVGENIRYLLRDRLDRPVACLLFGSAAWKCAERDNSHDPLHSPRPLFLELQACCERPHRKRGVQLAGRA
ncbi:MAG: DUF4338 domain-containing protein [Verrucomicrobia bacterium]|nr:DUF4338 domain-containing protein [Verrucomicrobiota bacterium]